jgi:hypothetical protein
VAHGVLEVCIFPVRWQTKQVTRSRQHVTPHAIWPRFLRTAEEATRGPEQAKPVNAYMSNILFSGITSGHCWSWFASSFHKGCQELGRRFCAKERWKIETSTHGIAGVLGAGLDVFRTVMERYPCAYIASLGLKVTNWVSQVWQATEVSCIHFAIVCVNAYMPIILPVLQCSLTVISSIGCFFHRHALYYDDQRQG